MIIKVFILASAVAALKREVDSTSAFLALTEIPRNDSRLPFPRDLNYNRLFCYDEVNDVAAPKFSTSFIERSRDYRPIDISGPVPSCQVDRDCEADGHNRYFCVQGQCRECRTSGDCPASSTETRVCSEKTGFTCSICEVDSDCSNGQICRTVFDLNLNKKRCVSCEASRVPEESILKATNSCEWICPKADEMIGPSGKCEKCPKCADGEMYVPGEDFSLTEPTAFFPKCGMASNAKCVACPGRNNQCAVQLSPSHDWTQATDVGLLPEQFPCNAFRCKEGWWLDKQKNQCRQCDFRSCKRGEQLTQCGGISPGICAACPQQAVDPEKIPFIDPKDRRYPVKEAMDVCKPQCPQDTYLLKAVPTYPWQCAPCGPLAAQCPAGYFYTGCGPNESSGECQQCGTQPMPGTYWKAGAGCSVEACDTSACEAGTVLAGCGGDFAGKCVECPNPLPENALKYVSIFDEITLTKETCGVECRDGYYLQRLGPDSTARYECRKCDEDSMCPLGQRLTGCGKEEQGECQDCPLPRHGEYFVQKDATKSCETEKCPNNSDHCKPGERFDGCGEKNPGSCESCGDLPKGAESWNHPSKITCDVNCKPDHFTEIAHDGSLKTCTSCRSLARQCPVGQHLIGCSLTSPGSCQACPALPEGSYWTSGLECETALCKERRCKGGEFAKGCALSNPGECLSCGPVLPNSNSWTVIDNQCLPVCKTGFYRNVKGDCDACDLSDCASGMVLTQCGDTSPGVCAKCTFQKGICFTGHGTELNDLESCPATSCQA